MLPTQNSNSLGVLAFLYDITVAIKFIMDRFSSIANIHQRYANREINKAIANNVFPVTLQPPPSQPTNYPSFPIPGVQPPEIRNDPSFPISISEAQRDFAPYSGLNRLTAPKLEHDSRIGEVMYDASSKGRVRKDVIQPTPVPGFLPWLLPGILIVLLLIFVIVCIYKHHNRPFSANSLRYYLQHPHQITDPKLAAAVMLASLDPNNLQGSNFQPGDSSMLLNGLYREEPFADGTCRQRFYYLQGMCYPCIIGYWNGTRCIVDIKNSSQQSNQAPLTQYSLAPQNNLNSPVSSNSLTITQPDQGLAENQRVSNLNGNPQNPSNNPCKDGEVLVDGRCTWCPVGSLWNGTSCQIVGSGANSIQRDALPTSPRVHMSRRS